VNFSQYFTQYISVAEIFLDRNTKEEWFILFQLRNMTSTNKIMLL